MSASACASATPRPGEVAFLLEPDLKEGRGGLRDVHALRWAQAARPILWDDRPRHPRRRLRHAAGGAGRAAPAHRPARRPAAAAGAGRRRRRPRLRRRRRADARASPRAARTIAWTSDDAWDRIDSSLAGPLARRPRATAALAAGLRAARRRGARRRRRRRRRRPRARRCGPRRPPPGRGTQLDRQHARPAGRPRPRDPPTPWPASPRAVFVDLLLAGPPRDRCCSRRSTSRASGSATCPSGRPCGASPSATPTTASRSTGTCGRRRCSGAGLAGRVDRPDLLVLAGLLHDIGKGEPGDHTENGVRPAGRRSAPRMGLDDDDAAVLVALCRHHLLLPDVATRRDLDDPATIEAVAAAAGRSREVLELLAALTEADSLATGPAAWSDWKAGLVRALVARVDHVLGGGAGGRRRRRVPHRRPAGAARRRRAGDRWPTATGSPSSPPTGPGCSPGGRRAVAARPGRARRRGGDRARAGRSRCSGSQSSFGPTFAWDKVVGRPGAALAGRLAIRARLADRVRTYGVRRGPPRGRRAVEPEVRFDLEASPEATVVEVHAPDAPGRALPHHRRPGRPRPRHRQRQGADARAPRSSTRSTCATGDGAKPTDPAVLAEIERALLHALESADRPRTDATARGPGDGRRRRITSAP